MQELCKLLKIKALRISVYHLPIDGLVELFSGKLKAMLSKFIDVDPWHWDQLLPSLLFTVPEIPQASLGFSPFDLLYGSQPRGILALLWGAWEEQESLVMGSVQYVLQLRVHLKTLVGFAKENLLKAQQTQKCTYNKGVQCEHSNEETGWWCYS